jgi:hypothetical protein
VVLSKRYHLEEIDRTSIVVFRSLWPPARKAYASERIRSIPAPLGADIYFLIVAA